MADESRVAIITGAAGSGMGRSIALTLARDGASVVVNYRTSLVSAEEIVSYIVGRGGNAIAVQADVFTAEGCDELATAALEAYGHVDICVVGPGAGWHPQNVDQLDPSAVLEDLNAEIAPLVYLMPRLLPGMYRRGWGRFVALAMHPAKLSPAYSYNVGKAARLQAALLAQEQAWSQGVTMNVIAPGPVAPLPDLQTAAEQCLHGSAWRQRANVSPQDVAEGVAFLCSDVGRFVSGCVLPYLFCR